MSVKSALSDITLVEAVLYAFALVVALALLDAILPVDLLGYVTRWLDGIVNILSPLIPGVS